MNFVRTISIFSAVAAITMTTSAWAANDEQHDSHHPASAASEQVTQASPSTPGIGKGMGGMAPMQGGADQMKAMQQMHEQMMVAKTPDERNALMAEHMKLMQSGMNMMGSMGSMGSMGGMGSMGSMGAGATAGNPADMAARRGILEQRMDMMQSMMQMMMDRMPSVPATK
ncbi:hypothetical protein [Simplicispira suum]|uniref:Uncharacterized protein n=1 Tax=Simplicispira suum TaxID=2109915 RepID=A0A2S0N0Z7_9BURK|nr:hypothetical protein [Simplicispira suum]AVO41717.1 hypothetical protein C6571_10850 [Simplicispira suum]